MNNRKLQEEVMNLRSQVKRLERTINKIQCKSGDHGDYMVELDCCGLPIVRCSRCNAIVETKG